MDAGFAIQACLVAISEILHAKIDQQTLLQVYEQIEPILLISLHEDGLDFMPDTCAIINMIIFKTDTITEKMWQLFPLYCYVMTAKPTIDLDSIQHPDFTIVEYFKNIYRTLGTDDYGSEMTADIAPVLKNFMSKGKDTFMQRAGFCGVSYLQIMFGMVSKVIKAEIESMDEVHYVNAFMLVGHFLSCYTYTEISSYYPDCLKLCIDYMLKKDTPTMRNVFLNNICIALYFGRTKTLEILHNHNILPKFLQSLTKGFQESATYRIRRAAFLGMLVFYSLAPEELATLYDWVQPVQMTEKLLEFLPVVYMERLQVLDSEGSEEDVDFFGGSEDSAEGELGDEELVNKVDEITEKLKELKKQKKGLYDEDAHDNLVGVDEVNFRDL